MLKSAPVQERIYGPLLTGELQKGQPIVIYPICPRAQPPLRTLFAIVLQPRFLGDRSCKVGTNDRRHNGPVRGKAPLSPSRIVRGLAGFER